jgi:urease accessory protein UreH
VDSARAAVRPLTADHRTARDVGRRARLDLTFGCREGRTVLLHSYVEPPYRIGHVLPDGDGVHVILASSGPGVFGGDSLQQTIAVQSGAQVRLTSQSATQIHANETGAVATIVSTYRVEEGAHLQCAWDPMIPFPDARLDQRISIELAAGATLVWSDALMAGREARGERWRFSRLAHELRLVRAGSLAYLERYAIEPGGSAPANRWTVGDACYFGTVLVVGAAAARDAAREVHQDLDARGEVRGSADLVEELVLLARLTSQSGSAFHQARASTLARLCRTSEAVGSVGL